MCANGGFVFGKIIKNGTEHLKICTYIKSSNELAIVFENTATLKFSGLHVKKLFILGTSSSIHLIAKTQDVNATRFMFF
jgi:hypothetical protein